VCRNHISSRWQRQSLVKTGLFSKPEYSQNLTHNLHTEFEIIAARFDIGVADPEEPDSAVPRPLMTFECGRNKGTSVLLGEVDAAVDHEGPSPADTTKLARQIKHAALPLRYALEFHVEVRRPSHHRLVVSRRREGLGTVFAGIMGRAVSAGKFHLHARGNFRLSDKQRPETSGGAAVSLETQGLRDRPTNSNTNAAG
jgi:hypothetical protein